MPGTPTRLVPASMPFCFRGVGEVVGHTAGDVGITATAPLQMPPQHYGGLEGMWPGAQAVCRHCGFMNHQDRSPLGTPLPGWEAGGSGEGDSLSVAVMSCLEALGMGLSP